MNLIGYQVELRTVESFDLDLLRKWRSDPQVSRHMLSQDEISEEQQQAWFNKLQRDQSQHHFVILYKNLAIGSANIKSRGLGKSLETARAIEPGLYIADERYRNNLLAFAPTLLLNDYCFETLGAQKLLAVVKRTNLAALNYNEKLGYKIETQNDLVEISLNFEDYQAHTKQIKALLSRKNTRN